VININGVNSGSESKVSNTSRALTNIVGDIVGNRGAKVVTKAERGKVRDRKASRFDGATNVACIKSSVVGATRDVVKGGNKF
jgi:hypothetical protein